jgi:hypothetical protein
MFLGAIMTGQAQQVSHSEAGTLAVNFFNERAIIHQPETTIGISILNQKEIHADGKLVMYAVNFSPEGFALVSASPFTFPVLGYSLQGEYTGQNEPENFKAWVRYFGRQLAYADEKKQPEPEIMAARERWLQPSFTNFSVKQNRVVEPLLRTTWDQGNYYNAQCPADPGGPGGHCWAGCVATAVGQLMFYHRWPNQGTGEYSYTHPVYGEQYANFSETTYHWNGMETSLNGPNSHIAMLLNHLGVSFDMDYGPNGSGMWNHSAANSMRNYFKYGPQTQYIFRDTTTMNWDSILIANLDARKPLYYAGWEGVGSTSGHAFVCDGYAPDNFYHFNWGWSNSYDGYFLLSALTPGGNNFNFAQEVIKDIYPDSLTYVYPEYCSGPDTISTIAGTFSDGSNMVNYLNNSDCFWLIRPNEPDFDSITSINLDFPLLDLEVNDRIRIYQGADTTATLIAEFSGTNAPPTLNIPSDTFLVRFTTDDTENAGGFLGSFKSVLPVYCSGTTTYTDSSGIFEDGSGDKKYNNNAICKWKIIPENLVPLKLTFESFSTEPQFDLLRIYDLGNQQLIATLSGDTLPAPVVIQSGKAYLVFVTNKEVTGQGWTIRWEPEGTTGVGEPGNPEVGIYPNPVDEQLWINPGKWAGKNVSAKIFSASGKMVLANEVLLPGNGSPAMINTAALKTGFYILKINSNEGTVAFRFMKL